MRQFPHTRLRRLRENQFSRRLVCETRLSSDYLICPLFLSSRGKPKTEDSNDARDRTAYFRLFTRRSQYFTVVENPGYCLISSNIY